MKTRSFFNAVFFGAFYTIAVTAISQDETMTEAQRFEFLRENSRIVPADELAQIQDKNSSDLEEKGYIEKLEEVPRIDYVKQQMAVRASMAPLQGKAETPGNTGYMDITGLSSVQKQRGISFEPSIVPSKYLESGTKSFLLLGGSRIKQLHEKTVFGPLLVDEFRGTSLNLENPNITIAGEPATLVYTKYQGDNWATTVHAENNGHMFIVEASSKLEGENRLSFIALVEDLMSNSFALKE